MLTLLGWIVGGFGLAIGVWFFLIFLDWLGDIGQDITEEQARERWRRLREQERKQEEAQQEEERRRVLWRDPVWRRRRIARLVIGTSGACALGLLLAWVLGLAFPAR